MGGERAMGGAHEGFEQRTAGARYTLSMFAEEVRILLAPVGIEARLQETADGTRSITAWPKSDPKNQAEFAIDQVRLGPYQAHIIATIIQRSFRPVTSD
jgi:hypothetical protein